MKRPEHFSEAAVPRDPGPAVALPRFPAGLRFAVTAARMAVGSGDAAQLRAAAEAVDDWGVALAGLKRQGLTGLVAPILKRERAVPPGILAALEAQQGAHVVAALIRVREVLRIVAALETAKIRYLLIKGVALSIQLHGDPAVRGGRDIDIWIERGRMSDAEAILAGLGYVAPVHALPKGPAGTAPPKESGWVHAQSRILVELHDRLTENRELLPWDFDRVWVEREHVAIGSRQVPAMSRARLPVYLAVHGAKSGWSRLMWLADLAVLLDGPDPFERARADAAAMGLEGMMLHAFWLLHRWLGRPVPGHLLARAARRADTRLLNAVARRFQGGRQWHEEAPRHSLNRFLAGSLWSRSIAYLMQPSLRRWRRQIAWDLHSPHDHALFGLSPRAAWLYPLLRPFGWIIRRLRR